jgi:hypothetical protein
MAHQITFAPCTGFGDAGRSCLIRFTDGRPDALGAGETDEEAVCEALMDSGLDFGAAFDLVAETLKTAEFIERR